jgi:hypothetical protein
MGRKRKYNQDDPDLVQARLRASAEALRSRGGKAMSVRLEADELEVVNLIKQQRGLATARDAIGFALQSWRAMSLSKSKDITHTFHVTVPIDRSHIEASGKAPFAVTIAIAAINGVNSP